MKKYILLLVLSHLLCGILGYSLGIIHELSNVLADQTRYEAEKETEETQTKSNREEGVAETIKATENIEKEPETTSISLEETEEPTYPHTEHTQQITQPVEKPAVTEPPVTNQPSTHPPEVVEPSPELPAEGDDLPIT